MCRKHIVKERIIYLDILRIVAIIAIISLHVSGGYLSFLKLPDQYNVWKVSLLIDVISKWGTAVFLMISGVLMLAPRKVKSIKSFLIHRFIRIFVPFIIWVFIYKLIQDPDSDYSSVDTYLKIFKDILTNNLSYHLWFVYMIFSMYLITPVLSVFINNAPQKTIQYYFMFWILVTLIPQFIEKYFSISLYINHFLTLNNYVGFYMIGYYFQMYTIKLPKKIYLLIPISMVLNFYLTKYASLAINKTDYFYLTRFSIWNVINAILIFHAFMSFSWEKFISPRFSNYITTFSLLSYGVFLCHVLVIWIFDKGILGVKLVGYNLNGISVNTTTGFVVIITVVSTLSYLLCFALSKIPFINKLLI